MSAAIAVRDHNKEGSSAMLLGTFDKDNRWFLVKHLGELDGHVVIDLRHVDGLDAASMAALEEFCRSAATQHRRVVFRPLRRPRA